MLNIQRKLKSARKRGGRPRKSEQKGKTAVIGARITPVLRAEIDQAAKANGRSLSDEIEDRLRRSLNLDADREKLFSKFGDKPTYAMCRLLAEIMREVSNSAGRKWLADPWTYDQVRAGIAAILSDLRPTGNSEPPEIGKAPGGASEQLGEAIANHVYLKLELTRPDLIYPDTGPDDFRNLFSSIQSGIDRDI
jgi:hypothetical protein